MVDSETANFVGVKRFRQSAQKGVPRTTLEVSTPSDGELTSLAKKIEKCATDLQRVVNDAWDLDEEMHRWRSRQEKG